MLFEISYFSMVLKIFLQTNYQISLMTCCRQFPSWIVLHTMQVGRHRVVTIELFRACENTLNNCNSHGLQPLLPCGCWWMKTFINGCNSHKLHVLLQCVAMWLLVNDLFKQHFLLRGSTKGSINYHRTFTILTFSWQFLFFHIFIFGNKHFVKFL